MGNSTCTLNSFEFKWSNLYEVHWEEMEPVTEAERKALLTYKRTPCTSTCDALRAERTNADQTTHCCASNYWLDLCSEIQNAKDTGNAKGMYDGINKGTDPSATKTALLKTKTGEVIMDQNRQLECWVEHYLELYVTQNVVPDASPGGPLQFLRHGRARYSANYTRVHQSH